MDGLTLFRLSEMREPSCAPLRVLLYSSPHLVQLLLDRGYPRGRSKCWFLALLGEVEGKKAFLELDFEVTGLFKLGSGVGQWTFPPLPAESIEAHEVPATAIGWAARCRFATMATEV